MAKGRLSRSQLAAKAAAAPRPPPPPPPGGAQSNAAAATTAVAVAPTVQTPAQAAELVVAQMAESSAQLAPWLALERRQVEFREMSRKNEYNRAALSGIGARNVRGQKANLLYLPRKPDSTSFERRGLVVRATVFDALASSLADPALRSAAASLATKTAKRALANFRDKDNFLHFNLYELNNLIKIAYPEVDDPYLVKSALAHMENLPASYDPLTPGLHKLLKMLEQRLGHPPTTLSESMRVFDFSCALAVPNPSRRYSHARLPVFDKSGWTPQAINTKLLDIPKDYLVSLLSSKPPELADFLETADGEFISYDVEAPATADWIHEGQRVVYYLNLAVLRNGTEGKACVVAATGAHDQSRTFSVATLDSQGGSSSRASAGVTAFADALVDMTKFGRLSVLTYSVNYLDERQALSGLVEAGYVAEHDLPGSGHDRTHMFNGLNGVTKVVVRARSRTFTITFYNLGHLFRRIQNEVRIAPNVRLATLFALWATSSPGSPPTLDPRLHLLPGPNELGPDSLLDEWSFFVMLKAAKCLKDVFEFEFIVRSLREIIHVVLSGASAAESSSGPSSKRRRVDEKVRSPDADEPGASASATTPDGLGAAAATFGITADDEARFTALLERAERLMENRKGKGKAVQDSDEEWGDDSDEEGLEYSE